MVAVAGFTLIYKPLMSSLGSLESKGMNCGGWLLVVLGICWQKVMCEVSGTSAPSKVFFILCLVAFQVHYCFLNPQALK